MCPSTLQSSRQRKPAFVEHALGKERLPAVADPLSPEEGARAHRRQQQVLVVHTPLADPSYRPAGGVVRGDRPGTGQPRWAAHRR